MSSVLEKWGQLKEYLSVHPYFLSTPSTPSTVYCRDNRLIITLTSISESLINQSCMSLDYAGTRVHAPHRKTPSRPGVQTQEVTALNAPLCDPQIKINLKKQIHGSLSVLMKKDLRMKGTPFFALDLRQGVSKDWYHRFMIKEKVLLAAPLFLNESPQRDICMCDWAWFTPNDLLDPVLPFIQAWDRH